ncbi:aminoglycoside phosphotransferase (APT) family kinase protein [Nonomuraea thailandensis]|uniref:Aminoglycoside phosphotransferase (APT) family kinase protein n=1 Tax=Nonomuraea thailandensis TaxID=1188745 RepID=A0A9X2GS61_9ACTN|nr:phosphotransferase [Nonomuraea thailandensis]MCP2364589.1 aminoglycoside phosphotransferase (APT) family kinase protein [Nonomuraea thailandensis]
MELGELVGTGRSADVYAIGDGRVLRRYRVAADAGRELEIMAHVAAHGYPVPEVFPGESGATDLVMGRLSGPTMLHALLAGEIGIEEAGRTLAALLRRLHRVPARVSRDPRDRILHLDLHPDNVMLTPDGPVVIDWCNAREGRPALDCALSALILAQAAVDGESDLAQAARALVTVLTGALGEDLDPGGPLDDARARRAADRGLTAHEVGLLDEAVALIRRLAGPR